MTQTKNKPVHTTRHGRVHAAIWPHHTKEGVDYSVSFERRYRSNGGWKSSSTFFRGDLPALGSALLDVQAWILLGPKPGSTELTTTATEETAAEAAVVRHPWRIT